MLKIELWNIIFTVINVLLLLLIVRIFLIKPIRKIIAKRQEEADEQFEAAALKQSEADELKNRYETALMDTEAEKKQILIDTRKTANDEYRRIIKDANEEAKGIRDTAVTEAKEEKTEILNSAKKEIADMVVDAVSKVVSGDSTDANAAIYDTFLEKAGDKQ